MKIEPELQREIILREIKRIPVSGLDMRLRAFPPPQSGWLIEIDEDSLRKLPVDDALTALNAAVDIVKSLNRLGIRSNVIRTVFE